MSKNIKYMVMLMEWYSYLAGRAVGKYAVTVPIIMRHFGCSQSKARRIRRDMTDLGMVYRDGLNGRYYFADFGKYERIIKATYKNLIEQDTHEIPF